MEGLFIYLTKTSVLITLFSLGYYLFLKKDTFFNSIRFYLAAGIITSFIVPLITVTKTVWVTPNAVTQMVTSDNLQMLTVQPLPSETFEINWWYVTITLYAIGVLFFLVRFIIDLYRITILLKNQKITRDGNFKLIDTLKNISPFSFFSYIVYSSSSLSQEELMAIIAHEKVHSRQLHSFDMLLSQLSCILLWFNPVSWIYKKQITQNLEFIADAEATKALDDIKSYQKTLLKITLQPQCLAITNQFYQSLIKKRIIMLNKQQSKKLNFLKFTFIILVIAGFIYLFQTEVVAKEHLVINNQSNVATSAQDISTGREITYPLIATTRIDKNLTDAVISEKIIMYKDLFDAEVIFKNLKRNNKGEITALTVMVKDKNYKDNYPVYEISTDSKHKTPINAFTLTIEKKDTDSENIISFGEKKQANSNTTATTPELTENNSKNAVSKPATVNTETSQIINNEKTYVTTTTTDLPVNNDISVSITDRVKQMNGPTSKLVTVTKTIVESPTHPDGNDDDYAAIRALKSKGMNFDKAYLKLNGKEVSEKEMNEALKNNMPKFLKAGLGGKKEDKKEYGQKAYENGFLIVETY